MTTDNQIKTLLEKKDRNEDTEQTKCYLVTPSYKKSVYEELMYTKYYGAFLS